MQDIKRIKKNKKQENGWSPEVDRKASKIVWFEVLLMVIIVIAFAFMVRDML